MIAAAKEMNKIMGLEPPIDLGAPDYELLEKLKEGATWIDPEMDEFSAETFTTLKELNIQIGRDEDEPSDAPINDPFIRYDFYKHIKKSNGAI